MEIVLEISDEEVLAMDEWEVDMRIVNAPRLNIGSQGVTTRSIKMVSVAACYDLLEQILKHQEVLREAKKVSE